MTINIHEDIPVSYSVDVVVVGGGPAGIGAAFMAARNGLNVLIIEQMNCLGGIASAGWHGHICCYDTWNDKTRRIVGGTCWDLAEQVTRDGYGTYDGTHFEFEVEWFKYAVETMAKAIGGIQILYYTQFSGVVMDGRNIDCLIIQNKSGRQAVKAKIVIDCTGDADVAAKAGVPYEKGRPGDGAMQPMTLMFQMGGVDAEAFSQFQNHDYLTKYNVTERKGMEEVFLEAQRDGFMEPFQTRSMGWWWCATRPDQMGANFTHINHRDPTNTEDLTYATIEGRRQTFESIRVFNRYIPGLNDAWVSHTGALIGTRESRRIKGEYCITVDDLAQQREFEDSIGYGSFFIDIHNCTGPGMDTETHYPDVGFHYQIPYRALVPMEVDNLLAAGRCISCDHIALGSLRLMPQCFIEGDAAGAAAAIALATGHSLRHIDTSLLQETLRKHGAIITSSDIVSQVFA
ncbi:pyridine nucleotide-disulfide oxidoreductase [Clostridia bacterium]|nr:pyridine nucleotide-disulfide oxidoreductase [Clostridia bacterium]